MPIPKGRFLTIEERTSRFLRLTRPNPNGCMDWIGTRFKSGYGICVWGKKHLRAHRVSYQLFSGEIPNGAHVLHRCDRPICVKPAHLFLGNPAINAADCRDKGRKNSERGEKRYNAKLNEAKVRQIRDLFARGRKISELAVLFHVSTGAVHNVILRLRWKHVV